MEQETFLSTRRSNGRGETGSTPAYVSWPNCVKKASLAFGIESLLENFFRCKQIPCCWWCCGVKTRYVLPLYRLRSGAYLMGSCLDRVSGLSQFSSRPTTSRVWSAPLGLLFNAACWIFCLFFLWFTSFKIFHVQNLNIVALLFQLKGSYYPITKYDRCTDRIDIHGFVYLFFSVQFKKF